MNYWVELGLQDKIIKILAEFPVYERAHHFGRPFLTSYQIAIEFARRYPTDFTCLGFLIGGTGGMEDQYSLAQYLAKHLSAAIAAGLTSVEGGILSYHYLEDLIFDHDGEEVRPSRFPVAMFRYVA